jgi:site-specific DNA recombinase
MVAAMAQWEREEIGDRVRASVGVRARLGKPLNGLRPLRIRWGRREGADATGTKELLVNPEQREVVRQIFEHFVAHRRKGRVARLLNGRGAPHARGLQVDGRRGPTASGEPVLEGTYVYNSQRRPARGSPRRSRRINGLINPSSR